jgi:hypothetical protein
MGLTRLQREIISRAAMAVLGLALLYGGYRCLKTGWQFHREYREQHPNQTSGQRPRSTGAALPFLIGVVLAISGAPFVLAAVLPSDWFAKLMGPPRQIGLHEYPGSDNPRGPWR